MHDNRVLILDFGSQFTQLIARRVREAGIYSEIHPCNVDPERVKAFKRRHSFCPAVPPVSLRAVART